MKQSIKRLIFSLFTLFFASAISSSIMSVVQTNVIREYDLIGDRQGFMDLATRVGSLASLFSIPFLQSKVKRIAMVCMGAGLMIINMCMIGLNTSFVFLIFSLICISMGFCYLENFLNALILDLSGEQGIKYMNLLHMSFAIGAMINPFIINSIRNFVGWRSTYAVIAGLLVTMLIFFLLAVKKNMNHPVMKIQKGLNISKKDIFLIVKDKRNFLTALAATLYTSYQMGIANWIVTYLTLECAVPQDQAIIANSLLWMGIVLSRFMISRIRYDSIKILSGGSFIAAPLCMLGILSGNFYLICGMTFICGFLCGHGIPTLIVRAGKNNPGRTVLGISIHNLIGGLIGLIWPPLIGSIQGGFSYRIALLIPGLLLLASAIVSIFLLRACRKHDGKQLEFKVGK